MRIAAGTLFLALAAIEASVSDAIKPHQSLGVTSVTGVSASSRKAGWGLLSNMRGGSAMRESKCV